MNLLLSVKILLFIIDPQVDFCDPNGSLYVPGAENKIEFVADYIKQHSDKISDILVSQDSHNRYHVGHAAYWINEKGEHPAPFTQFSDTTVWKPTKADKKVAATYLAALKAQGRTNTIWPDHCIVGTSGWEVYPALEKALNNWNNTKSGKKSDGWKRYKKGSFADAEMFSVLSTFDGKLVDKSNIPLDIEKYDKIIIAGVAEDICVAETTRDLLKIPSLKGKLIFMTKGMAGLNPKAESLKIFDEACDTFGAVRM